MNINHCTVSIIAIFYNLESFAERCIESILAQTNQNFELILIDDGSTDETRTVLLRYATVDNVRVYSKENGGPGSARNYGVQMASTDWIMFIDGDDILSPHAVDLLSRARYESGCKAVFSNPLVLNEGNARNCLPFRCDSSFELLDGKTAIKKLLYEQLTESPWAKLLHKSLMLKHPFPEDFWYEDVAVAGELFLSIERVAVIHPPVYGYVMGTDTVTHRRNASLRQAQDFYEAIKRFLAPIEVRYPEMEDALRYRYALELLRLHALLKRVSDPLAHSFDRRIVKETRRYINSISCYENVPFVAKMRMKLFYAAPGLHDVVLAFYERYAKGRLAG